MPNERLYVINPNGVIERWDINKAAINIADSIVNDLCGNVTVRGNRLLDFSNIPELNGCAGFGNLTLDRQGNCYATVRLKWLTLNAPWNLESGILVPAFASKDLPIEARIWTPPPYLWLALGAVVLADGNHRYLGDHFLIAYDAHTVAWRLPVSNLHSNCKLCHGQKRINFNTVQEALVHAIKALQSSQWNEDLYEESGLRFDNTRRLFRFKPENGGDIQIPPDFDWTRYCEKVVAPEIAEFSAPL